MKKWDAHLQSRASPHTDSLEPVPRVQVERHAAIVRDLLQRVVRVDPDNWFVTDQSSLWDFHDGRDNKDYIRRIALLYEVDVSDLEPPTLADIARRIHERRLSIGACTESFEDGVAAYERG